MQKLQRLAAASITVLLALATVACSDNGKPVQSSESAAQAVAPQNPGDVDKSAESAEASQGASEDAAAKH